MERPELIIFDVDGTMLNTEFIWQKAWEYVAEKNGIEKFGKLFNKAVGTTGDAVTALLNRELPDVPNRFDLLDEARIKGAELIPQYIQTMPGLCELLDCVDEMGIRKAVATTTSRINTEQRLAQVGILNRFEYLICGDEVSKRKPDPEIYNNVLKKMKIQPQNALVIEDTKYGVLAAYNAGIRVIMVPSINLPDHEDLDRCCAITSSLNDILYIIKD
jgi:beta-phosphoglucomutase-like phosphatase (HAD superfamily)